MAGGARDLVHRLPSRPFSLPGWLESVLPARSGPETRAEREARTGRPEERVELGSSVLATSGESSEVFVDVHVEPAPSPAAEGETESDAASFRDVCERLSGAS